jgi:hypothetical protein
MFRRLLHGGEQGSGSDGDAKNSKPANAPLGKGRKGSGSKPANAPIGSNEVEGEAKR